MLANEVAHCCQHQGLDLEHADESEGLCAVLVLIALPEGKQEQVAIQIEAPVVENCKLVISVVLQLVDNLLVLRPHSVE